MSDADILTVPQELARNLRLPKDIAALSRIVQAILVHDAAISNALYGPVPDSVVIERDTQPVRQRLRAALVAQTVTLAGNFKPYERQVGTCRDYAAMLCALARLSGYEARVRCGFARYFGDAGWEDHWIIQYRKSEATPWAFADAQLDAAHLEHYAISFDPADLPEHQFLTADKAWQAWRAGTVPVEMLQHGSFAGERLACVNLVRDALALRDVLTSDWDQWRGLEDLGGPLSPVALSACDQLCQGSDAALSKLRALGLRGILPAP